MSLVLEISRRDDLAVVTCRGRIVFGPETTDFCRTVRDMLPHSPRILLNLCAVEYIDSGGLGSVIGLLLAARRVNGDLAICEPSHRVETLLHLTKLSQVIPTFSTQEQALAQFGKSSTAAA